MGKKSKILGIILVTFFVFSLSICSFMFTGCTNDNCSGATPTPTTTSPTTSPTAAQLTLTSTAFLNNGFIPLLYTSATGGGNQSIPLAWSNPPQGTQFYAIIMRDTSASNLIHWFAVNIPAATTSLAANASVTGMPAGTVQLNNQVDLQPRYVGPNPPLAETHTYVITIYALPSAINNVTSASDPATVLSQIQAIALGSTTLTGRFTGI